MTRTEEAYNLLQEQLPTIPVPHDGIIKEIMLSEGWLTFSFENNISRHDAVRCTHPDAQSLTMRFHLIDEEDIDLFAYEERKYESVYVRRRPKKLLELARKSSLSYLMHYVAYGALQIELCADSVPILLGLRTDRVVMDWLCQRPEA